MVFALLDEALQLTCDEEDCENEEDRLGEATAHFLAVITDITAAGNGNLGLIVKTRWRPLTDLEESGVMPKFDVRLYERLKI